MTDPIESPRRLQHDEGCACGCRDDAPSGFMETVARALTPQNPWDQRSGRAGCVCGDCECRCGWADTLVEDDPEPCRATAHRAGCRCGWSEM